MPKVVDHDQRRAEIVLKARELIGELGADAMTMRNLAERCGTANGGLRRYFRLKDDVLRALDEDLSRRFELFAVRRGYRSQRGLGALRTVLNSALPLDRERAVSAEVVAALRQHSLGNSSLSTSFHDRTDLMFERFVAHLHEAHEDGELSGSRTVKVTAAMLVHMIIGINMTASIGLHRGLASYDQAAIEAVIETA